MEKEDAHKFMYVMKGPASSQQKKVFYVYGKGWGAKDGMVVKPTATKEMGQDPTWPLRQHPNDVYYNITFLDHGNTLLIDHYVQYSNIVFYTPPLPPLPHPPEQLHSIPSMGGILF